MSAKNFVLIKENKKSFMVMMLDADTDSQIGKAEKFTNLRDAVRRAQAIVDWEDVEYGIRVDLFTKKE